MSDPPSPRPAVYTLESSDHIKHPISREAMNLSSILCDVFEHCDGDIGNIPISKFSGKTVQKVVEWCECHKNCPAGEWRGHNPQFITELSEMTVDDLIILLHASCFFDISDLKDACAQTLGRRADEVPREKLMEVLRMDC